MTPSELCTHWQGEDECPAPGCYRRLPCVWTDEAWGLGQYSNFGQVRGNSPYAFFGRLINGLKYQSSLPSGNWHGLSRNLAEQVSRFITKKGLGIFDVCVVITSNRPGATSVMRTVAEYLGQHEQVRRVESLAKRSPIKVIKGLPPEQRSFELAGKFVVPPGSGLKQAARILILDDVFDTGATLREVAKTVRADAPRAKIVAITATYLRDPKEGI